MPQGCLLPAEWADQSGVMLTWPHSGSPWGELLPDVEKVYQTISHHVSARELLLIVHRDAAHRRHIKRKLEEANVELSRVRFAEVPSNDSWARDHGAITVLCDGEPRLLSFRFNGWGEKHPHDLDDLINDGIRRAGLFGEHPLDAIPLVLEGGSIDTDGQGTLLTTRHCLMTPTRNPQLSQAGIESALREHFGVSRVLWLEHGHLAGDDTDAHIDTLARFCNPDTITYMTCEDPDDEHFTGLQAMEREIQALRTAAGEPYKLVPLPMPAPIVDDSGQRLPASYANFLIINGAVLIPVYGDANDTLVVERLTGAFPDHTPIAIDCRPLIHQYGSLHCITMQFPAGVLA
ncbi:MAG: agmatine deiminase family protein [Gammaproteobacteria bacterium]